MNTNAYTATHDALTSLPNEYLFLDRLNQALAIAERGTNIFALLMVLPDNYTRLEQLHGQAFGDQLILQIAERMQVTLREPDTVTRRENNTFLILIPQIEDQQALTKLVLRLNKALAEPFQIDSYTIHMSFSLGKAVYPYDGVNADLLMQHVEAALKAA